MTGAKSDLMVWMHPNGWAWDAGGHIKCSIIAIVVTIADGIVKSASSALIVQYFGLNPPNTLISFLNLLGDASMFRYSA